MPELNHEFGDGATLTAPDPLTEDQRRMMRVRDLLNKKADLYRRAAVQVASGLSADRTASRLDESEVREVAYWECTRDAWLGDAMATLNEAEAIELATLGG